MLNGQLTNMTPIADPPAKEKIPLRGTSTYTPAEGVMPTPNSSDFQAKVDCKRPIIDQDVNQGRSTKRLRQTYLQENLPNGVTCATIQSRQPSKKSGKKQGLRKHGQVPVSTWQSRGQKFNIDAGLSVINTPVAFNWQSSEFSSTAIQFTRCSESAAAEPGFTYPSYQAQKTQLPSNGEAGGVSAFPRGPSFGGLFGNFNSLVASADLFNSPAVENISSYPQNQLGDDPSQQQHFTVDGIFSSGGDVFASATGERSSLGAQGSTAEISAFPTPTRPCLSQELDKNALAESLKVVLRQESDEIDPRAIDCDLLDAFKECPEVDLSSLHFIVNYLSLRDISLFELSLFSWAEDLKEQYIVDIYRSPNYLDECQNITGLERWSVLNWIREVQISD